MDVYLRNYQRMKRTKNIYGCILSFYKIKYEIVKISKFLRRKLNKKMKYKLFKKIEAFALAGCMILSFSGCGDKTETQEKKVKVIDENGVCLRDDNYYSKGNLDPERYDLIKFDPSTYFSDSDEQVEKTTETTSFVKTK